MNMTIIHEAPKKTDVHTENARWVPLVNKLIADSFGSKFKGNYDIVGGYDTYFETSLIKVPFLRMIMRKKFPFDVVIVGRFFDEKMMYLPSSDIEKHERIINGSRLEVNVMYRPEVEAYAKAYEKRFNKEVEVQLINP